jgi:hydrogenase maturation protease
MSAPLGPLVVIGIGNILLRDDGVGVHVVNALRRLADHGTLTLPVGTRLVDGGTLGVDLLPEIDGARAVLFVDAADLGRAPGTVATIGGDALRRAPAGSGRPRAGVAGLLATAELAGVLPRTVSLVGIQPHTIDAGLEPSGVVFDAVPAAVASTLIEIGRLDGAAGSRRPPAAREHQSQGEHEMTGARA